jgi:hypothetical protein
VATKLSVGIMGLFVLLGAGGFFGAAISAMGLLKLPTSFECPVVLAPGKEVRRPGIGSRCVGSHSGEKPIPTSLSRSKPKEYVKLQ